MNTLKLHAYIKELGPGTQVLYMCQEGHRIYAYIKQDDEYTIHALHRETTQTINRHTYVSHLVIDYDDHWVSFLIPPKLTLEEAKRERDNP